VQIIFHVKMHCRCDLGQYVNGGESGKRKASLDVEAAGLSKRRRRVEEEEEGDASTPRGQLVAHIENLSLASQVSGSVVDPNPKDSEYFGWIRVRIRKKSLDSDLDPDPVVK
jgi:hypothetical protein